MYNLLEIETNIDQLLKEYEQALKDGNKTEEVRICVLLEKELSKIPSNEIKVTTEQTTTTIN